MAGKRFEDVTDKARLNAGPHALQHGLRFLDYDNDGRLDLFVANYLKFDLRPRRSRARIRTASIAACP